jgi:hypothetical protein
MIAPSRLTEPRPAEALPTVGPDRVTRRLAVLTGAVALASVASLVAFFVVGGPFGAINDWTIGIVGFLTGLLAVSLSRGDEGSLARPGIASVGVAVVGAAVVVFGSWLVISDTTGYLLAGLVESVGFALIGIWLIAFSRSLMRVPSWPRFLSSLGTLTGAVLAIGFILVPGIAAGVDDAAAAPIWVWIGFVGWLGILFLYPIWCIWFGFGPSSR